MLGTENPPAIGFGVGALEKLTKKSIHPKVQFDLPNFVLVSAKILKNVFKNLNLLLARIGFR